MFEPDPPPIGVVVLLVGWPGEALEPITAISANPTLYVVELTDLTVKRRREVVRFPRLTVSPAPLLSSWPTGKEEPSLRSSVPLRI